MYQYICYDSTGEEVCKFYLEDPTRNDIEILLAKIRDWLVKVGHAPFGIYDLNKMKIFIYVGTIYGLEVRMFEVIVNEIKVGELIINQTSVYNS